MTLCDPTPQNKGEWILKNSSTCTSSILHQSGVCIGKPAPHVELCIYGNDRSNSPFTIGRILTRGMHMMVGYWDRFASIVSKVDKHGWFDTGDIGCIDENGDLWLIGRTKDRIKSGGENIYPQEVEAVISHHPGVSSIVVIGVPDARLTEMVAACVQIRENWKWVDINSDTLHEGENFLSGKILQNYCKAKNLTGFKIPKIFIFWKKPFPFTSSGKLRREEVKREALSSMQTVPSRL